MNAVDTLEYPAIARRALEHVQRSQSEALRRAACLLAEAIARKDLIQAFGTGHSRAVTLELCARAGGLASTSMLAVKDLVMFGGEDPAVILDPKYEREPGLAGRIYDLAAPSAGDAFVLVSNSGINPAIVEMALLVKERGHALVAITSLAHTRAVPSRDATGLRLADIADVVVDNGAPVGDAALALPDGSVIGGLSDLTGIYIVHLLVELICRELLGRGLSVPVLRSANTQTGDDHNDVIVEGLAGRIRPIEP